MIERKYTTVMTSRQVLCIPFSSLCSCLIPLFFPLLFDVPPLYATRRCSQTSPLWISNHLVHMTLEIAERVGVRGATEARELSLGH